jgi:16S rRNA (cytosine967-C5)-methyltransferase
MLHHAASVVRLGGSVVYATCSSEPEENEDVVQEFVEHGRTFRRLDAEEVRSRLPAVSRELVNDDGFLRTWPFLHGLEAFFGAVLVRVS